ncbi:MAG: hypothetical protein PHW69_08220, partial [Elusimicrobiaceae bacterium]|nr:hypothetical protein [Elusimicrobiaceae bacterium]
MLKLTAELFKDLLARPRGAYVAICRSPRALYSALAIFLASLLAEAALLLFLPPGFIPDTGAEKATAAHILVQLGMEVLSVAAITFFLALFGSLARKFKGVKFMLMALGGLLVPMIAV